MSDEILHIPVLCDEVVKMLNCKKGGIYVDATIGLGGHSQAILNILGKNGKVIGIDKDESVFNILKKKFREFKNIFFVNDDFSNIRKILNSLKINKIDGIIFDLGISSLQLDSPKRGFSFKFNSVLDMRMSKKEKLTAEYLLNNLTQKELENIIRYYGEEKYYKNIAKNAIEKRKQCKLKYTNELIEVIENSIPQREIARRKIHPATLTFQALRIFVNDELNALKKGLKETLGCLNKFARICVISFHSLEDRIVKETFKMFAKDKMLKIITKKPITPCGEEIKTNRRSRSAKLRVAEKI